MVNLFFVISGYVLSFKSLSLIYESEYTKMYEAVASSLSRRAFRLWLPTMGAILLIAVLAQLRAFEPARHVYTHLNDVQVGLFEATHNVTHLLGQGLRADDLKPLLVREIPPPMANSTLEQVFDAFRECLLLVKASTAGHVPAHDYTYDAHVWTIPVEFKSSMAVFILTLATSKFTSKWRLISHATVMVFCVVEEYRTALFVAGMILAELDIIQKRFESMDETRAYEPSLGSRLSPRSSSPPSHHLAVDWAVWGLFFVLGLYLLSVPFIEPVTVSPYAILAAHLPSGITEKNKVIRAVGAVMTTWSCVHFSWISPIVNSWIAQYLGKISFALYLTHGLVIRSVGYVILGQLRALTGAYDREHTSLQQFVFIWCCGYVIMLPVWWWTADLFWRSADAPSVRLARWLELQFRQQTDWNLRDKDRDDNKFGCA